MLKLQIVSDLHIEFIKNPSKKWDKIIKPSAPYLCILGDLCPLNEKNRVRHFLERICPHFERVFYVFGNHEFFSFSKHKTIKTLSTKFKKWSTSIPNLTVLDNNCVELEGFIIVGATLWTFVHPFYAKKAVRTRNDFRSIAVESKKGNTWLTVKEMNRLHRESVVYIERCIATAEVAQKPMIILTHHAPLHDMTTKEVDHTASTDLSPLFRSVVKLWAFGHTHKPTDSVHNETLVYSNPKGYKKDTCYSIWDPSKTITVVPQYRKTENNIIEEKRD